MKTSLSLRFLAALAFTCGPSIEGGYCNDPHDPGGETNHGLSDMADGVRDGKYFGLSIKNLTDEQVEGQYYLRYWAPAGCEALPAGLDLCLFDFAVNSGVTRAVICLQQVLGVRADGSIGPKTLAAINASRVPDLIERYCEARLAFMKTLPTWGRFGKGWESRVNAVQKKADTLYASPPR